MAHATQETSVPPPLQDLPDAKTRKYDRQLRLWGAAGQVALENTHVLLVNSGSGVAGVETLKNLVLPGIGQFTILDSAIVDEADLGVNFFLDDDSLGKYRAEETVRMLEELNPDVRGYAIKEPLESWISHDNVLTPYTLLIISAPLDPQILQILQSHARRLEIPAFYIHSAGFYSHFSLSLSSAFPIVDTHPDPITTTDLRLLKPWPDLGAFARAKTANMEKMNGEEFAHIPWVCLLLHYLAEWQSNNNGKVPETYKEKTAFRELVRTGSANEENFDEACAAVLKSLNPPTASSSVLQILNAPETQQITSVSPPFWLIANAISQFYVKHGELPLPGAVPDMKSRSDTYIQLQSIYKAKAREDCAEVIATVRQLEKLSKRLPEHVIDEKEIENFCKGAAHISLVRGRPFKIAQPGQAILFGDRALSLARSLEDPENPISIYLAFLAWDEYTATHIDDWQSLRVPGTGAGLQDDFHVDTERHAGIAFRMADQLLDEAGVRLEDAAYSAFRDNLAKICTEMVRAGGGELHNIASLTGGLVAQEVIKVITRQYVPIDNVCVFDGIASRTGVLKV